jgi:DNA modification methylase
MIGASHTGASDALGHESTPFAYARNLADVFGRAEVARHTYLASDDASVFVVLGDTFARARFEDPNSVYEPIAARSAIGVHHLFVAEMRHRGWRLWQEIVWVKPSAVPSGATRLCCNPSHEYVLWFDTDSAEHPRFFPREVREEGKTPAGTEYAPFGGKKYGEYKRKTVGDGKRTRQDVWPPQLCADDSSSWVINPSRSHSAHVAPFPEALPETAILACTLAGDVVLDPFAGTRTTERVAVRLGRRAVSIDINKYE